MDTGNINADSFLEHFQNKYKSGVDYEEVSVPIYRDLLYEAYMTVYNKERLHTFRLIPRLQDDHNKSVLGKKILIIKSGLLAAGKSFVDPRPPHHQYFFPDFIFGKGDILGDYEAPMPGNRFLGTSIPKFAKLNKLVVDNRDLYYFSEGLRKYPINVLEKTTRKIDKTNFYSDLKSIIPTFDDAMPLRMLGDRLWDTRDKLTYQDTYRILKRLACNHDLAFSARCVYLEMEPERFWDVLKEDAYFRDWFTIQSLFKTKRIPLSIPYLTVNKSKIDSPEQQKIRHELFLLFSIIINNYSFLGVGETMQDDDRINADQTRLRLRYVFRLRFIAGKAPSPHLTNEKKNYLDIDNYDYMKIVNQEIKQHEIKGIQIDLRKVANPDTGRPVMILEILISKSRLNPQLLLNFIEDVLLDMHN